MALHWEADLGVCRLHRSDENNLRLRCQQIVDNPDTSDAGKNGAKLVNDYLNRISTRDLWSFRLSREED